MSQLLHDLYDEAKQMLTDERDLLDRISEALLERETLEAVDLARLKAGEVLPPLPPVAGSPDQYGPPPERTESDASDFPGDKLPDPEPVPG